MFQEVIQFWFEEIDQSQWWVKDEAFDALIQSRFSAIHDQAAKGELFSWRTSSAGALAEIIVLDQFSRNMYRDTAQSFAYDAQALTLAQAAITLGYDTALTIEQRPFMYLPFMHSESRLIHEEAVTLYTHLGIPTSLEFELKHKTIIEKFGRYPHRNNILGRTSSPEELAFLSQPNSSF